MLYLKRFAAVDLLARSFRIRIQTYIGPFLHAVKILVVLRRRDWNRLNLVTDVVHRSSNQDGDRPALAVQIHSTVRHAQVRVTCFRQSWHIWHNTANECNARTPIEAMPEPVRRGLCSCVECRELELPLANEPVIANENAGKRSEEERVTAEKRGKRLRTTSLLVPTTPRSFQRASRVD